MSKNKLWLAMTIVLVWGAAMTLAPAPAQAAPPVVKTVPWVPSNPLIPHDTYAGRAITLKGTCDSQGANFAYSWDFGDGSPPATGIVSNKYVIEATHSYSGAVGTVFTARLTVQNTDTGEQGSQTYYVALQNKSQVVEVNIAIDQGLWYLHKTQTRTTSGVFEVGYWNSGAAGANHQAVSAANVNAFEVNGHLESGSSSNPYTETVARGMRQLFTYLGSISIGSQTNSLGTFNPDVNGNGIGIVNPQGPNYYYYTTGMFMDAIVASGTPDAVAPTGPATIVLGRKYKDIVQDMVDAHSWAQYDSSPQGGGWRLSVAGLCDLMVVTYINFNN